MTWQQREAVAGMLRASPFDPAGRPREQRLLFSKMITAAPVPADVITAPGQLGGVPVIRVEVPGTTTGGVIVYFHSGFFAIGSAAALVGLVSPYRRDRRAVGWKPDGVSVWRRGPDPSGLRSNTVWVLIDSPVATACGWLAVRRGPGVR
jgi:hypothetical protein